MSQYKINLTLLLNEASTAEVASRLEQILSNYKWEMGTIEVIEDKLPGVPIAPVIDTSEPYCTFRVADEKFRVFAKDLGLQGTELKVPKNRDFLQLRIRAFLEQLGYKIEPKVNIRVVAESHVEMLSSDKEKTGDDQTAQAELVYTKRI
ncbi:MAG TPA: hypothetical protein VFF14_07980 [Candidatus Deferrimicrobium sp.]|nr:hypothetical protein [Candidatus Deferrimicrobium sp.]